MREQFLSLSLSDQSAILRAQAPVLGLCLKCWKRCMGMLGAAPAF